MLAGLLLLVEEKGILAMAGCLGAARLHDRGAVRVRKCGSGGRHRAWGAAADRCK